MSHTNFRLADEFVAIVAAAVVEAVVHAVSVGFICTDKQRVLTPGHQGWNDLHSLCRIGMEYYLLNNDDNNDDDDDDDVDDNNDDDDDDNRNNNNNDNDYNHNNDTNNDNNENDNDKNSSESMPVIV